MFWRNLLPMHQEHWTQLNGTIHGSKEKDFLVCLVLNTFTLTCLDEALFWLLTTSLYSVSSVVKDPPLHRHLLKYVLKFRNSLYMPTSMRWAIFCYLRPFQKQEFHLSYMVLLCGSSPVTADQIREATNCEPHLSYILQFVQQGWPSRSLDGRCSLRERTSCQSRMAVCFGELNVVVPKVYWANVLIQLHEGHPGATRMKALSRMYVWWPGITVSKGDGAAAAGAAMAAPLFGPIFLFCQPAGQ